MRRTVCLLAALLVLPALGSDSPKEYDDRTEGPGIDGEWVIIGGTRNGRPVEPSASVLECRHGEFTWRGTYFGGHYAFDLYQQPAHLDWTEGRATLKCIFRVEGNTFWMAYFTHENGERPSSFGGKGVEALVFKRIRK